VNPLWSNNTVSVLVPEAPSRTGSVDPQAAISAIEAAPAPSPKNPRRENIFESIVDLPVIGILLRERLRIYVLR